MAVRWAAPTSAAHRSGPPAYRARVVDDELGELMAGLPALSLDGPTGVGKTSTAAQSARTVFALDDPRVLEVVTADPTRVVRAPGPVLIDEWQRHPPIWDAVRRAVDADPSPGRFLLTYLSPRRVCRHTC